VKCQLIQSNRIPSENKAEQAMLQFLSQLPGGYFVYRELKVQPERAEATRGLDQRRPDFVVVSPEVGLLSIEVKDWNLSRKRYVWSDQYRIQVTGPDGSYEIDNPVHQADCYRFAFMELLRDVDVYVSSVVAFPRLTRQEFLNKIHHAELLKNPQAKFVLDLDRTIYKEDIDQNYLQPDCLLRKIVNPSNRRMPYDGRKIYQLNRRLLPNEFRIGEQTKRQQHKQDLKILSQKQQKWIFGVDRQANYLLDVAGSGKTNALLSKSIHLLKMAESGSMPKILITTYNDNLKRSLRRIFRAKLEPSDLQLYQPHITIADILSLMEQLVSQGYNIEDPKAYYRESSSGEGDYQTWLSKIVEDLLRSSPQQFAVFDHVLIDEIQDFDDHMLLIVKHLCKSDRFFFVGDIGQKIYDRSHDLQRLGFVQSRIDLPKIYQMYRTPRYIAELATRFALKDPHSRREFERHGYHQNPNFPNNLDYAAEMHRSTNVLADIVDRVKDLLGGSYLAQDLMLICAEPQVETFERALRSAGIACVIGEHEAEGRLSIVPFLDVKGLEREVVLLTGIESFFHRGKDAGLFQTESEKIRREWLSRNMIYVSLTRTIEQLLIYYQDPNNPFMRDLLAINQQILDRRQRGYYGQ